jgi:hypothetical protein
MHSADLAHIQMCCTLARSAAVVQQALALVVEGEVGSSCSGLVEQPLERHSGLAGMVEAVQECNRLLAELAVAVEAAATAVVVVEDCMSDSAVVGSRGPELAGFGDSGSSGSSVGQEWVCYQTSSSTSVLACPPSAFQ